MLDPLKVATAQSKGMLATCSLCTRYHLARDKNVPEPLCLAKNCGSPIVGLTFPEYDGPITDHTVFCFACGARAEMLVGVQGQTRVIGVCEPHVKLLVEFTAQGKEGAGQLPQRIIYGKDEILPVESLNRYRKKTLMDEIIDTEIYYNEQDEKGKPY